MLEVFLICVETCPMIIPNVGAVQRVSEAHQQVHEQLRVGPVRGQSQQGRGRRGTRFERRVLMGHTTKGALTQKQQYSYKSNELKYDVGIL